MTTYWQAPPLPGPLIERTDLPDLPLINTLELLPDVELLNPLHLAEIDSSGTFYNAGETFQGAMRFSFKRHLNVMVLFSRPDPKFHVLNRGGGPIFIGYQTTPAPFNTELPPYPDGSYNPFWFDGHISNTTCRYGLRMPILPNGLVLRPPGFMSGDSSHALVDAVAGETNWMWIAALPGF